MHHHRKAVPKVASTNNGDRNKKSQSNPGPSNLLEPLVEVRPIQPKRGDKNTSDTYRKLRAQLAKSHRNSEKLNLIRPDEPSSVFTSSLLEPTHAQLLEADSRKNEALLQIYTDSGTFSKVIAMTVAASVLDSKLPYDVVQSQLDGKKREDLSKFCGDINGILGIPSMKAPDMNDYRRLWHLYSIFTRAMDQRICAEPRHTPSDEDLAAKESSNETPGASRRKTLEETSSDAELIETIRTFNPNLYRALQDPLERFLVVYGRYASTGHVNKSNNLRNNVLNEYIQRYHERVAYTLPARPGSLLKASNATNPEQQGRLHGPGDSVNTSRTVELTRSGMNVLHKWDNSTTADVGIARKASGSVKQSVLATSESCNVMNDERDSSDGKNPTDDYGASDDQSTKNKVSSVNRKMPTPGKGFQRNKTICLEGCRYDVVRRIALESGFREVGEHDVWSVIWTDVPLSLEKALEMRRFQNAHAIFWGSCPPIQKANHFPGMNEICRKDRLARNLNRMKKSFPEDYNFFPRTWSLPADAPDLMAFSRLKKNATYICKPDSGCQGKGIFLVKNLKKLNPFAKLICQVYIPKPLLIDGYKFDLRIYILVTSCDPLRVFIYNEGIARFATVKYSPPSDTNIDVVYMHLTNYSLNKFSQSYDLHSEGSKRKMSAVLQLLASYGHDISKLSDSIDAVVVKTMIAAQPTLRHYYRASFPKHDIGSACFEILGFDILVDRNLKPFLLEVNHSPSFNLDLPVDAEIKEALLRDTFSIIYMGNACDDKRVSRRNSGFQAPTFEQQSYRLSRALQLQVQHEKAFCGNFRLIYPIDNSLDYGNFFDQSNHPAFADATISYKG